MYSTTPGDVAPPVSAQVDGAALSPSRDEYAGPARVATYTVAHGRDGEPHWGLAVCDLADGSRCYARLDDADLLAHVETVEWVGSAVTLTSSDGVNRVSASQA